MNQDIQVGDTFKVEREFKVSRTFRVRYEITNSPIELIIESDNDTTRSFVLAPHDLGEAIKEWIVTHRLELLAR